MVNFQILVATFSKTSALTSKNYVFKPDMSIPNLSDRITFLWQHSSGFVQESSPTIQIFRDFLPLKEALVASFSEKGIFTSIKHESELRISIWNLSEQLDFCNCTPPFMFQMQKKSLKYGNISDLFTSIFLWPWWLLSRKGVNHFLKIGCRRRYSSLSKAFQYFWSHCTAFSLEKQSQKCQIFSFLLRKQPLVATLSKTHPLIFRSHLAEQDMDIPNQSEIHKLFWLQSSVFDLQ